MSEPYQLYARVRLSPQRLREFLASDFPDPSEDAAVLSWLANAQYYGERYTPELIRERLEDQTTVGEWIESLKESGHHGFFMPSRNQYDGATQTWTLGILDFSENYDDYIAAVAVFRMIAHYKDLPGDDGMLIYGFLYEGGAVSTALWIQSGASAFLTEDEAHPLVVEANQMMDSLVAEGAAMAGSAEE